VFFNIALLIALVFDLIVTFILSIELLELVLPDLL
ncbi:MAG: hypothetical protein ACI92E_003032, partial [Oceanicoccus sp.]